MTSETLANLHTDHSHPGYRVTTDGTGRSWLEVPAGDDLGGHLAVVRRKAQVADWPVIERDGATLVPTYAYDRVVVAGLRCAAPVAVPGPGDDYLDGRTQQEALRGLMQEHGLTGAQVGALVGVDGRTVRRWLSPDDQSGHRTMPYAVWHTLQARIAG